MNHNAKSEVPQGLKPALLEPSAAPLKAAPLQTDL